MEQESRSSIMQFIWSWIDNVRICFMNFHSEMEVSRNTEILRALTFWNYLITCIALKCRDNSTLVIKFSTNLSFIENFEAFLSKIFYNWQILKNFFKSWNWYPQQTTGVEKSQVLGIQRLFRQFEEPLGQSLGENRRTAAELQK